MVDHIPEDEKVKPLPDLVVTRGDGIPLPDQKAALEEFKKRCRRTDVEYLLAAQAAREFVPMRTPDIFAWQKAAYEHGYVQALLDVQDGKIKL